MNMEKWRGPIKCLIPAALVVFIVVAFPTQVAVALQLTFTGAVVSFLLRPLARRLERHMRSGAAALLSVAVALVVVTVAALVILPPLIRQLIDLIMHLDALVGWARGLIDMVGTHMARAGLPAPDPGALDFSALTGRMGDIVDGTAQLAGSVVGGVTNLTLGIMMGVYFLLDWENLLLTAELVIPSRARPLVLRMAGEAGRGLRAYLRGQLTISLIVGALAAAGLALIGVRSALALGVIVGILNMVPYFGPILGGVPAVLAALSQDMIMALMAVAVLFVVQQIDGMLISPRVMSGVTGLPPAAVLLALTVGGSGWGIMGMLLALPAVLIVRICFRVWVTRNEVIENLPDM